MNEFTIRIEAPELARAITNLASALGIYSVTVEEQNNQKSESSVPVSNVKLTQASTETKKSQHTIEEVRAAVSEHAKAKGKDKAKALLSKYEATKVTELKTEDYDAAIRDIREC